MTPDSGSSQQPALKTSRRQAYLIACFTIFLLAFGVRILTWHDTRLEVGKVQTVVVADYQRIAELLHAGGIRSFFSSSSALADPNTLGHPPGYPILIAGISSIAGRSITAVQMFQIAADALAAVVLFLIVAELLPLSAGIAAGLLAAFSPQFAWNSVLLLPDSISVLPILLAIYLLTRAVKKPRLLTFILIGALIGVSCWLRANAMLLTLFLAAAALLMFTRTRWQFAAAIICGTLLIVLPLTIRNAIVFHRFIPVSLGAGQTFLEGIADYDKDSRFGVPSTDMGIMKQEAEIYQRPDYYGTLFNPDGVERERARLSRGFAIVRSHPFWFAGVMTRRASSMLRLERSRSISSEPATTHPIDDLDHVEVTTLIDAQQLFLGGVAVPGAVLLSSGVSSMPENDSVSLQGNADKYGPQFLAPPMTVKSGTDYVVTVPVCISAGRMRVNIENASGKTYSTQVLESLEPGRALHRCLGIPPNIVDLPDEGLWVARPDQLLKLPFVATRDEPVRVVWANEASAAQSSVEIGSIKLYELGPARYVWTRYPRIAINAIQKIFLTAAILPLGIIGLVIMTLRKQSSSIAILSVVPIYFFAVQSAVHTEYRYVIAVTYFLFAFAGVAIGFGVDVVLKKLTTLVKSSSAMGSVRSA
jgi:hypothetical protein